MCDLEYPVVCKTRIIKSKKDHQCIECGRIVPKGESLEKFDGLYDDEWKHYYTCEECFHLRSFIEQNISQEYPQIYGFGELLEFLWNADFLFSDDEIQEEISSFGLLNYQEHLGVPMGRNCPISTKVSWLKIVEGRYRLDHEALCRCHIENF